MSLVLKLKRGTWYKDGKYVNLPQVQKNINFLNPKEIEIVSNKIEIGRNSDNDIILDSNYISRSHCQIRKGGWFRTTWYIKDLKSKYETIIYRASNKKDHQYIKVINNEIALKKEDIIILGNYEPVNLLVVST